MSQNFILHQIRFHPILNEILDQISNMQISQSLQ